MSATENIDPSFEDTIDNIEDISAETKERQNKTQRPSAVLMFTEGVRALWDLGALAPSAAALLSSAPRGDNHPVLVLPGFMASDRSTYILRSFLRSLGYKVHGWGLGRNRGPRDGMVDKLGARVNDLYNRYDRQKITVIGQSLGGIYARFVGHRAPDKVRQVIMLGAPFAGIKRTARPVQALFEWSSGMTEEKIDPELRRQYTENPSVPSTAIYSKLDGITHWRSCIHKLAAGESAADQQIENIEVMSSHVGMAVNPTVLYAVADRLALDEGQWRPFAQSKANSRLVYPKPEPVEQVKEKRKN